LTPKNYDLILIAEDLERLRVMDHGKEREALLYTLVPVLCDLIGAMAKIADKISEPVESDSKRRVAQKNMN
jgi:hypothetical protein